MGRGHAAALQRPEARFLLCAKYGSLGLVSLNAVVQAWCLCLARGQEQNPSKPAHHSSLHGLEQLLLYHLPLDDCLLAAKQSASS